MLLLVLKCLCRLDITSSFVSQILRVQRSPAPSLVEGAAAVFTPIFCRLPPHKGKYVCRLENSTNTTKNFQNTNYPFTSHSFGERSPKVSIFRLKYQMFFLHWTIQNMVLDQIEIHVFVLATHWDQISLSPSSTFPVLMIIENMHWQNTCASKAE